MAKIKTRLGYYNARIIILKALHKLTNQEIAKMTGFSTGYVKAWFSCPDSKFYRLAPKHAYTILTEKYSFEIPYV